MDTINEYIEYDNKKNQKNKKLLIILSICIGSFVLLCTVLSLLLFLPVTGNDVFEKTLESLAFDYDNIEVLEDLAEELNGKAFKGTIEMNLPTKMTGLRDNFNLKTDFHMSNQKGVLTFSLIGKKGTYTLDVSYTEEHIGIRGLYDDPETCLTLPRNNIEKAFEESIFHPNSGTAYAMEKEDYEDLVEFLKILETENKEVKNSVKQYEKELALLVRDLKKIVKPKSSFSFSDDSFGLRRTVKYTFDSEKMRKFLKTLREHVEDSEYLVIFWLDSEGNAMEKKDIISEIRKFENRMHKSYTAEFSYTIHQNKITEISFNSLQSRTTKKEENKLNIVIEYYKSVVDINIDSKTITDTDDQRITVKNEMTVRTKNTDEKYSLRISQNALAKVTVFSDKRYPRGLTSSNSAISTIMFEYDKTNSRYNLKTYSEEDETYPDFEYGGEFVIDEEKNELRFTVDVLKEGVRSLIKSSAVNIVISICEDEPEIKELKCDDSNL